MLVLIWTRAMRLMRGKIGSNSMYLRAVTLLLSGAIGLLATGCAASAPTVRGQNPDSMYGGMPGQAGCESGMCESGSSGYGGQCEPGGSCQHCGSGCRGGAGCNIPFHPVHRNFHTYNAPQGLMYPPENSAPAQVQYPYYTLRGPTDFFME